MDKKQAIFNENDIPYKELELIGISKKQKYERKNKFVLER